MNGSRVRDKSTILEFVTNLLQGYAFLIHNKTNTEFVTKLQQNNHKARDKNYSKGTHSSFKRDTTQWVGGVSQMNESRVRDKTTILEFVTNLLQGYGFFIYTWHDSSNEWCRANECVFSCTHTHTHTHTHKYTRTHTHTRTHTWSIWQTDGDECVCA